jgi:hypothetical protein
VTPRDHARNQALGRAAIGVGMLLAPERVAIPWIGSVADREGVRVLTRALGAREVVLGVGQARAVAAGHGVRPWVVGGVVADATDLVATVRSRGHLPLPGVAAVAAVAAGSTLLGLYLARELD